MDNRLYAAHGSANGSFAQVTYGALLGDSLDGINWIIDTTDLGSEGSAGSKFIGNNDGQTITAIASNRGNVFTYKNKSTYVILPDQAGVPYDNPKISDNWGTLSAQSVFAYDANVFNAEAEGVFGSDGSKLYLLSYNLGDLWANILSSNLNSIVGAQHNKYLLF